MGEYTRQLPPAESFGASLRLGLNGSKPLFTQGRHTDPAQGQTELFDALVAERADAEGRPSRHLVRRSINVSIGVNIWLSILQVFVGLLAHSHSLLVDGFHSLSDLLSDVLVLFVARHSSRAADEDHPYGHARMETVATLVLGVMLVVIGGGFLYSAAERAVGVATAPPVEMAALYTAILALVSKEVLFRYMLHMARKADSAMLTANAWHSRSDAASSLVVALGIGASLMGFVYADLLAAAIVGALILRMGWRFSFDALNTLIDKAANTDQIRQIEQVIRQTPGVTGVHSLRTRWMADRILVDAHLQVAPRISVSEGHHIAVMVRQRVRNDCPRVLDMLVHIDPENDQESVSVGALDVLPSREFVVQWLRAELDQSPWGSRLQPEEIRLHYLNGQVEVEMVLSADAARLLGAEEVKLLLDSLRQAALAADFPVSRWRIYNCFGQVHQINAH